MSTSQNEPTIFSCPVLLSSSQRTAVGFKAYLKLQLIALAIVVPLIVLAAMFRVSSGWVVLLFGLGFVLPIVGGARAEAHATPARAADPARLVVTRETLALPLPNGHVATLARGPDMRVRAVRYYNTGHSNVPATYGVFVELARAEDTYLVQGEGSSPRIEALGIERDSVAKISSDRVIRIPLDDALTVFELLR